MAIRPSRTAFLSRLLLALLIFVPLTSSAVKLVVLEKNIREDDDTKSLRKWVIPDFVGIDPQGDGYFKLDPRNPKHQALLDLMAVGLHSIKTPGTQQDLTALITVFADPIAGCDLKKLEIKIVISKIGRIEIRKYQTGIEDSRRISSFMVSGCVQPVLPECRYSQGIKRDTGLGLGAIKDLLINCFAVTASLKGSADDDITRFIQANHEKARAYEIKPQPSDSPPPSP